MAEVQPMKKRLMFANILLLSSCAVLDYKPTIISAGDPAANRINQDLEECHQMAKASTVNSTEATINQLPATVRFKDAYDNCMIGRGHKVLR
jgi:hypothetical protein